VIVALRRWRRRGADDDDPPAAALSPDQAARLEQDLSRYDV
jgi:hypothetical protein